MVTVRWVGGGKNRGTLPHKTTTKRAIYRARLQGCTQNPALGRRNLFRFLQLCEFLFGFGKCLDRPRGSGRPGQAVSPNT